MDVRSLNPGFIPTSGCFAHHGRTTGFGATAFAFFAGLAGFAVPIDVGGERLGTWPRPTRCRAARALRRDGLEGATTRTASTTA